MVHLINHLAQASAHYRHLRMLCALLLTPWLGVLYVVCFDRLRRLTAGR